MKTITIISLLIIAICLNNINHSLKNINKSLQSNPQSQTIPKPQPLFSIDSTGAHTINNDTLFK